MKKRIMFCFLLVGLLCALIPQLSHGSFAAEATSGNCGDQLTWSFDPDSGTLSISGTGDMWDFDVYDRPWYNNLADITSIQISEGVTSIGSTAFYDADNVSTVSFPSSLKTIGSHAFELCIYLRSIAIPNGVTTIGDYAFNSCLFMESASIPQTVTYIGEYAFENCSYLRSVSLPSGLTELRTYVFGNCHKLESVTLPDRLVKIGSNAFYCCRSLEYLEFPRTLTHIEYGAFYDCERLSVYLPDTVKYIGAEVLHGTFDYNYFMAMGDKFLYSGKHLIYAMPTVSGDIIIPEDTLTIAGAAFINNDNITSVTIPHGVVSIGLCAFYSCNNLSSVTIPDSVEIIGREAFYDSALYNNSANWDDGSLYIGNYLIEVLKTASDPLVVRQGTLSVAHEALVNLKYFKTLVLPDSVKYIHEVDFYHIFPNDGTTTSFDDIWILNGSCTIDPMENRPGYQEIVFHGHPYSKLQSHAEKTEQTFVPLCTCWLSGTRSYIDIVEATCTTSGQITFRCGYCSLTANISTLSAQEHHFTQYENLGSEHKILCSNCDYFFTKAHQYTDGFCICGAAAPEAALRFRTLSLKGNIAVNYYMELSEGLSEDETAYMLFTMEDGEQLKVPATQAEPSQYQGAEYYVFSCELSAKEMTDTVTCQFFHAGGQTDVYTYSIKTYADNILKNSTDEALRELIYAMLNYGAASQIHFGYRTDRLANEGLETPDYTAITIEGFPVNKNQGTSLATFAGASLLLTSETTLRIFFNVDASVEETFSVTYEGQALPLGIRSGRYYADIPNISAKDLDNSFTMVISDGTETAQVSYSPLSYCASVIENPNGVHDRQLQDCAAAIYLYNQAANGYFDR